jgi:hypothetical protein
MCRSFVSKIMFSALSHDRFVRLWHSTTVHQCAKVLQPYKYNVSRKPVPVYVKIPFVTQTYKFIKPILQPELAQENLPSKHPSKHPHKAHCTTTKHTPQPCPATPKQTSSQPPLQQSQNHDPAATATSPSSSLRQASSAFPSPLHPLSSMA